MVRIRVLIVTIVFLNAFAAQTALLVGADLDKQYAKIPLEIQKGGVDYGGDSTDDATISAANEFSWRSFLALNWPATDWPTNPLRGVADKTKDISELDRPRVWETWKASYEMIPFQPATGNAVQPLLWNLVDDPTPAGGTTKANPKVFGSYTPFADISQALMTTPFPGTEGPLGSPLVCQNHTYTHFEVRMNRSSFATIRGEGFYLRNVIDSHMDVSGDAAGDDKKVPFEFPHGSISVKASWRELVVGEDSTKYYTRKAKVQDYKTNTFDDRILGLVGMHIVQKTPMRDQWIWTSFEHASNVPGILPSGSKYSYNDGATTTSADPGPIGPTNLYASPTPNSGLAAASVVREISLHPQTQLDNKKFHDMLSPTSVWQNYYLVLTQWPTLPKAPATATELEGKPFPLEPSPAGPNYSIANTTMETWFQSSTSCISCHELAESSGFDYVFFPAMHARKAPSVALNASGASVKFIENVRQKLKDSSQQSRAFRKE